MSFREIDDVLWNSIEPYFPPQKPHTGRPRANMRKLMNGILYVVMTGCTWKEVPRRYGSKSTVHIVTSVIVATKNFIVPHWAVTSISLHPFIHDILSSTLLRVDGGLESILVFPELLPSYTYSV